MGFDKGAAVPTGGGHLDLMGRRAIRKSRSHLVQQDFAVDQPNRVWVSDISYIATGEGWLYLCIIMDLFARKIIGWSM